MNAMPTRVQAPTQLVAGAWLAQAIAVIAKLDGADLLSAGRARRPSSPQLLAARRRQCTVVLLALAGAGIFAEDRGSSGLAPLAALLCSDAANSIRAYAVMAGERMELASSPERYWIMSTQDPVIDLMRLVSGFQASRAISVIAELGIADVLKNDALHIDAIAQATECHPRSLYRLLHMLASVGVLEELAGKHFKLTPLGECLRFDSPCKRSAWARYAGRPHVWQSWGAMMHSVKTGESSFGHLHGANLWEWRSKRRDEAEIFDAAMSELSGAAGKAIASSYDFSVFDVIVDVGGGQGALLAAVLAQHKTTKGILFDLPHVVVRAQDVLRAAGVTDRCEIVGGDVFKAVPEGGGAYLIKSVLMDENDDQAIAILMACRSAIGQSGKVVVVEHLLTLPNGPEINFSDMTMMIMTGGRERTREEFSELFSAAGFHLEQVVVTKSPFTLMVGAPV